MLTLFFLTSGLFLGWSLGANNTANVFGPAVGSGMIRFKTAIIITSIFVVIGSVVSGEGVGETLDELGKINGIAGAFIVAMAAGFSVYWMTLLKIPVSITQSIVGAIVGWNIFAGVATDMALLTKILSSWFAAPLLAALFAMIIYKIVKFVLTRSNMHILKVDHYNRVGFLIIGAFAAYSLGANNISSVMGVFIFSSPFKTIEIGIISLSSTEQLFLIGGLAIAFGVISYSGKVMKTVGKGITEITPIGGLVIISASSLVLFIFASERLGLLLAYAGLPAIPLVPVSSSQAIVGAIMGIAFLKKGSRIDYRLVGKIGLGWIATPVLAAIIAFVSLFVMQNVFRQDVYYPVRYMMTSDVSQRLKADGLYHHEMDGFKEVLFPDAVSFKQALRDADISSDVSAHIMRFAELSEIKIDAALIKKDAKFTYDSEMMQSLEMLDGKTFRHKWQFEEALAGLSPMWKTKPSSPFNKEYNRELKAKFRFLYNRFLLADVQ